MHQVKRNGVFETNSSSTHSICIGEGDLNQTLHPNEDGVVVIYRGEFGWEYETYDDPASKASYIATACENDQDDLFKTLKAAICEHTGAKDIQIVGDGYIDHQSYGCWDDAASSVGNMKHFLFNSNSLLITDNDNH